MAAGSRVAGWREDRISVSAMAGAEHQINLRLIGID
jgi:hypothetical protein